MKAQALGLIEAVSLPAAIAAADAALKAANVTLVGYDNTKGRGLIVVKLRGEVGAVKVAVEAGAAAAQKVNKVYAAHVIPRPHENTEALAGTANRGPAATPPPSPAAPVGGPKKEKKPRREPKAEPEVVVEEVLTEVIVEEKPGEPPEVVEVETIILEELPAEPIAGEVPVAEAEEEAGDICNLCGDPACPRRKGQPHKLCIHSTGEEA